MNAWLAAFADLLAMFRNVAERPPTDTELCRLFAHLTDTEVPR